ncbi:hypothetical protein OOJ91_13730 [Micromonospora lupini]|uniref:hypothetical protein n=1 Tax=Micromonospora lupini TaxID=285679 RepID=UPI002253D854|nr:hypothetical protein [Micromonospora lupini]MCX5066907.1 hypothetical protein [Micromonospora lupini]
MTDIEYGELKKWQHDLDAVLLQAPKETRAVVQRGALNIKRDAQGRVRGLAHAPAYPYAISYDTKETPASYTAEIGPDKAKRQGALGNLIEFGSVNNAPRPHMIPAGDAERPRFEKAMEDLAARILEGR